LRSVWKPTETRHANVESHGAEEPGAWRLTLESTLSGRWAADAERVWSGAPAEKLREVDLRGVTSVDGAGRDLLHRIHREGASFVADGVVMKALVEELRSEHLDHTRTIVRLVVALIVLAPVAAAHALMNAALK
jgi:hypothetical protein